jgi:hypothetical protein
MHISDSGFVVFFYPFACFQLKRSPQHWIIELIFECIISLPHLSGRSIFDYRDTCSLLSRMKWLVIKISKSRINGEGWSPIEHFKRNNPQELNWREASRYDRLYRPSKTVNLGHAKKFWFKSPCHRWNKKGQNRICGCWMFCLFK